MGVDLGELFTKEPCAFEDFGNRIIVLDAHNILHQFLSSIRQRDGTPLKDSQGRITSHLSGLLYRTAHMVEAQIRPVYVFDGQPHPLKARTIQQRRQRKEQAEREWKEALERGDLETAKTKAQQTSRVTSDIIEQSKQLLAVLGIPFFQAPSEGEAQASSMVQKGDAYAVGSQDFDCLLFGAPLLVRNLTSSEKRKLPNKQAYTSVHPERIHLESGLQKLEISREQLVDIALLVGTDFNDGVRGFGPKKSLKLLKEKGSLEQALDDLPEPRLSSNDIETLRTIFLKPAVSTTYCLQWEKIDTDAAIRLLCDEFQFSKDRVKPVLEHFSSLHQTPHQKNLFEF
ncbi:MAG: flap endonuclease-1 [Thermoplasmata archaeon M11B2D]|nr:MAG: flap endonuclease-1 [Thermoplasmata archaeon M11B2D]